MRPVRNDIVKTNRATPNHHVIPNPSVRRADGVRDLLLLLPLPSTAISLPDDGRDPIASHSQLAPPTAMSSRTHPRIARMV